jgi:hypothetical protein
MKQSYEEKSLLSLISSLNNLMEIQGIPGLLSAVGDVKQNKDYVQVSVSVFYVKGGDRRVELFSREQALAISVFHDIVSFVTRNGKSLRNLCKVEDKCFSHTPEDEKKVIDFRVLTRIKEVYQLKDIDVGSRRWRQVEARAIWTYYLIKIGGIRHADAAKIVRRKRSMMYHYVKLVEDLYETNIPFRERFNKIGIPWRS